MPDTRNRSALRILDYWKHHTEAHRTRLLVVAGINAGGWRADTLLGEAIRRAKDIGAEQTPLVETVPVYWVDGWWTCDPTPMLRLYAEIQSVKRNVTEQQRNLRCRPSTALEHPMLSAIVMQYDAGLAMLRATYREPKSDPVVARIETAVAHGRDYV